MKKPSSSLNARILACLPFFVASIFLLGLTATDLSARARSRKVSTRQATTVSPTAPSVPILFSGTDYDQHVFPCSTPLNGPFPVLAGQARIVVQVSATIATNDLTVTLLVGPTAGAALAGGGPEDARPSSRLLPF